MYEVEIMGGRFFNVIWLLSRSIPIIAIQLSAIKVDEKLLLHFTKVLDLFQPPEAVGGMKLFDRLVAILEKAPT